MGAYALDNGLPQRNSTNTASIFITVLRNQFAPVFQFTNTYFTSIQESLPGGSSVFTVTATDADSTVCTMNIALFRFARTTKSVKRQG